MNSRNTRFSNMLADLKVKNDLSQNCIAKKIGLKRQYITDIKAGSRPLTERVAFLLGQKLGIDYHWLLTGKKMSEFQKKFTVDCGIFQVPHLEEIFTGAPRSLDDFPCKTTSLIGENANVARKARHPYALTIKTTERSGRLRKGDIILLSHERINNLRYAVVRSGEQYQLAKFTYGGWYLFKRKIKLSLDTEVIASCVLIISGKP